MTENNGISAQFFHTIGHPGVWTTTSVTKMAPTKVHRTLRLTRNEVDFVACRNYKISILPGFPFTIPIIIRAIFPSDGFSRLQRKRIKKKKQKTFHCQLAWLCDCNMIGDLMLECRTPVLLLIGQFEQRLHSIRVTCVCWARWALSVRQLISFSRLLCVCVFFHHVVMRFMHDIYFIHSFENICRNETSMCNLPCFCSPSFSFIIVAMDKLRK